ncbi:MAG: HDIG domain-containing protein [Magnetococcales bacterium]|nr:HDIG domain-containing protein [Magnetococcales bacterium]
MIPDERIHAPGLRGPSRLHGRIARWIRSSFVVSFVLFWALVTVLTIIYSPVAFQDPYLPAVGEIAAYDIKANRDILIEDKETTLRRKEEASRQVDPVYDLDTGMLPAVSDHLNDALDWLNNALKEDRGDRSAYELREALFRERNLEEVISKEAFEELLSIAMTPTAKPKHKSAVAATIDPSVDPSDSVTPSISATAVDTSSGDTGTPLHHKPVVTSNATERLVPVISTKVLAPGGVKKSTKPAQEGTPAEDRESAALATTVGDGKATSPVSATALPTKPKTLKATPVKPKPPAKPVDPYKELKQQVNAWLSSFQRYQVVSGSGVMRDLQRGSYIVHKVVERTEKSVSGFEHLVELKDFRRNLANASPEKFKGISASLRLWIVAEAQALVRPNLVLNLTKTNRRRMEASEATEGVFFRVRRGEMVVREGAEVTDSVRLKIEALHQNNWTDVIVARVLGLGAILAAFFALGHRFLIRTSVSFPNDKKTWFILGAILLLVALISKIVLAVGMGLSGLFLWPPQMAVYLPPVALGSALASLIIGAGVSLPGGALVLGTLLAFLSSLMDNGGFPLFMYYLFGSLVGAFSLRSCRHRFCVLRAGVWIGLVQMAAVPIVESLAGNLPSWQWVTGIGMALSSGLLAGLLGLAMIPLLEWIFNLTTDSRLLELASGDHPLLKQLSLRAPGTYHHSVMMGNLAEAAAERIGANPLKARVMALYHDIGKMTKPHYFVENQSGLNRHDHLSPSMSAKIIAAHIKDGVELANRYNLSGPILQAITEHQGTGLLRFFLNKAQKDAARRGETVSEEDYRYSGPKPQSKESGILMVADSVEAAARTLKNPSPAHIQSLVKRIIHGKISDGQLDECNLTLAELARIEDAFCRVLILGFYHHRIEYPDQVPLRATGS